MDTLIYIFLMLLCLALTFFLLWHGNRTSLPRDPQKESPKPTFRLIGGERPDEPRKSRFRRPQPPTTRRDD